MIKPCHCVRTAHRLHYQYHVLQLLLAIDPDCRVAIVMTPSCYLADILYVIMHRGYARVPLAQNGTAYILLYDILWHINFIVCQKNGTVPCCVVIVYKLSYLMNCWFFITLSSIQIIAAPQWFNDTIQPTWSQQRLCSCHNRLMIIIIWWKMSFKPQSPQHTICCYCCCCAYTFYTIKKTVFQRFV